MKETFIFPYFLELNKMKIFSFSCKIILVNENNYLTDDRKKPDTFGCKLIVVLSILTWGNISSFGSIKHCCWMARIYYPFYFAPGIYSKVIGRDFIILFMWHGIDVTTIYEYSLRNYSNTITEVYNLELLAKIKSGIKRMQRKTYFCLNENEMRKWRQEHIWI